PSRSLSEALMHVLYALCALLLLAGCEGSFVRSGDLGRKVNIERTYEARDACLSRNAATDGLRDTDAATLAHAIALACQSETDKLISASDQNGDAKVAASIRTDSEFRAMKYIMQVRGQTMF